MVREPHQNTILAWPSFPVTVLVTIHSLHHALCLVQLRLIVLALHDVFFFFFRRVLLVQVTQTLFTDAATVVLVVYDIGTPTEIHQP